VNKYNILALEQDERGIQGNVKAVAGLSLNCMLSDQLIGATCFVRFADLRMANSPIMADFQLPT
jgi:hypothetical protein